MKERRKPLRREPPAEPCQFCGKAQSAINPNCKTQEEAESCITLRSKP
jgi:hypothetical protein